MTDREERFYLFGRARAELDEAKALLSRAKINLRSARSDPTGSVSEVDFEIDMALTAIVQSHRSIDSVLLRVYDAMRKMR